MISSCLPLQHTLSFMLSYFDQLINTDTQTQTHTHTIIIIIIIIIIISNKSIDSSAPVTLLQTID